MPRIDPIQLLNCLSVLLSPNGGIKSRDEVQRLANLMTKFSKKLVSKCIYIQILKCTETDLLGLFMGSGGWRLVHMWLTESIVAKNWPLVRELLELLLLCPVDIEHLKTNNCPKLVKELSKDGNQFAIRALASKLVEQWLKTVKGEHVVPIVADEIPLIISEAQKEITTDGSTKDEVADFENNEQIIIDQEIKSDKLEASTDHSNFKEDCNGLETMNVEGLEKETETLPVLKISLKDGKQVLSQVDDTDKSSERHKDKHKSKSKEKSQDKNSSKSSSSKHSSKTSSSNDKHRSEKSDSPNRHSSKEKSRDKSKHSSHSSKSRSDSSRSSSDKSSSHSKSREDRSSKSSDKGKTKDKVKEEKTDKKKENPDKSVEKLDEKPGPPSIHKLGKIPKLSDVKREKPSISIEVRKPDEPKPKTVKTFHSKFRKHGLEEEIKPPPSRASLLNKKPPPVLPPAVPIPKRPSPVHNETPPEKKPKTVEPVEKPGAIKLIPPKPKRLQECQSVSASVNINLVSYIDRDMLEAQTLPQPAFNGSAQDLLHRCWELLVLQMRIYCSHQQRSIGEGIKRCLTYREHSVTDDYIHTKKSNIKYDTYIKFHLRKYITSSQYTYLST